jgi:hypothetical protein
MDNVILIEGSIILALGVIHVIQQKKPVTPVFVGSIGLLLIVSLLDTFGGTVAAIGKALLSLATFSVVIAEGTALFTGLENAQKKVSA